MEPIIYLNKSWGLVVGEIEYNEAAELIKGAAYPEDEPYPIELLIVDLENDEADVSEAENSEENNNVFDAV